MGRGHGRREGELDVDVLRRLQGSDGHRAATDIANTAAQATAELRNDLAAQALAAAEAVVNNSLDDAAHGLLIDSYIDQIGATS